MPVNGYRRPELQAEADVFEFVENFPRKYQLRIPVTSTHDRYLALKMVSKTSRGCNPKSAQNILYRYPFSFRFFELDNVQKKIWRKACKKFTISELQNYFHSTNPALSQLSGNTKLIKGLQSINDILDIYELMRQIRSELELEMVAVKNKKIEFAKKIVNRVHHGEDNLEQMAYLYGPSNLQEAAELFFVTPSFFAKQGDCAKCDRELTNWLSIAYGSGPVCGKHKYDIKLVGHTSEEVSKYVITLVEDKFPSFKNGPISEQSPLLAYRKRCLRYFNPGRDLALRQHPFSELSLMREIEGNLVQEDNWKEFIRWKVNVEYRPH